MKPFKLQAVLDYRQLLESKAQQEFAEAQERESALISRIRKEEKDLKQLCGDFEKQQKKGINAQKLALYENMISHKAGNVANLADKLKDARAEVADRREALKDASIEKKLMEKLKEQQEDEDRRQLRQKETSELDEIAVLFHKR